MTDTLVVPGLGDLAKKVRARGELMALCLSGSHAYGLNNDDSDFDIQGVYRSMTSQNLLLWGRPKETLHEANKCLECGHPFKKPEMEACTCGSRKQRPDYTVHELFKFFDLAAKGNPTVLEVMYLQPLVSSDAWQMIVDNRDAFLSTRIRATYGGYAKQQLAKKKRREEEGMEGYSPGMKYRDTKHTRHIVRLFLQQRELLETGEINPMLSAEDQLFVLEAQYWNYEEIKAWMDRETLDLLEINDNIPPQPDYDRINELLLTLRGL